MDESAPDLVDVFDFEEDSPEAKRAKAAEPETEEVVEPVMEANTALELMLNEVECSRPGQEMWCLRKNEMRLEKANKVRQSVLEAFLAHDLAKLCTLAKDMKHLTVDEVVLKVTGIGQLVSDVSLWPAKVQPMRLELKNGWLSKERAGRTDALYGFSAVIIKEMTAFKPMGGLKATAFMEIASFFASWLHDGLTQRKAQPAPLYAEAWVQHWP